jgi:spermidine/putrescine transport system ATP-binding protein
MTEAGAPVARVSTDVSGPAAGATPGISLRGVSKRYGTHLALLPLELEIRDGEFFCLLGPSGCGKTTTLNLIGGFVAPTTGEIWIQGNRVDRQPPHKRNVNTVFQSYALFPHMTVLDNVAFGLKMGRVPKAESRARAIEALVLVGLEDFSQRLPSQLSGGQQQRVAVARALVRRPAVLLLDEPLGALDLKLRKRLQVELSQIHREVGTTFVYVTHDQEEAMAMADRTAVMNAGRIEQVGTPSEIYNFPTSRFVADFIGESNFFEISLDGQPGVATLSDGSKVGVPHDSPRSAGAASTLMVRPESIHLFAPEEAPEGAISAKTVQKSFLGSYTRVAVRCDVAEEPVLVAVHGRADVSLETLDADKEVALWWKPEDAVVIVEDAHTKEGTEDE